MGRMRTHIPWQCHFVAMRTCHELPLVVAVFAANITIMYEQLIRSLTEGGMVDADPQMMAPGLREQEAAATGLAMSLSRNSGRDLPI